MLGWLNTSEMNPACGSVPARGFQCALDHRHLIPELLLSCPWLAPAGRYKPPGIIRKGHRLEVAMLTVTHALTGAAGF